MGQVVGVYLADSAGLPMRSVESAVAAVGKGLLADRYQVGTGQWSYDPRLYDDVTLIAQEALAAASVQHGVRLEAGASRRNLETRGVDLDALVGRRFHVGEVELCGERPCEPCRYLDRVTGQPAKAALRGRGGLRATILSGGRLRVGDLVVVNPTHPVTPVDVAGDGVR
jgi:MOSC domain